MGKIKKFKGGHTLFVTEDEKLLVTSNSRNIVYVYDLETGKLKLQVRTVSNVSKKAISPDKSLLAAKNTQGEIALISMETGDEIGRNHMEWCEGRQLIFTADGQAVLDFDWDGRTMLLDCGTMRHEILDGPRQRGVKELPRVAYMQYDRYSKQIYKFVADEWGDSKGRILDSAADPENISYEVIQEFPNVLPDHLEGISLCKVHNYYMDQKSKEIVVADKKFGEVSRIPLPAQITESRHRPNKMWVSPCEQYVFIDMGRQYDPDDFAGTFHDAQSLSYLFKLDTMEVVQEFDYEDVSDFTMIEEDRKFILATWQGTYMGEV